MINNKKHFSGEKASRRYERIASIYDNFNYLVISRKLRKKAVDLVHGNVLEVGVGTGLNLPLYPEHCSVTGIDFSPSMLAKAKRRMQQNELTARLLQMDVEQMDFPDSYFDSVLGTFVFCSTPDPVAGLKEIQRVCKKGGTIIMLEHVRSDKLIMGKLMDFFNPFFVRILGDNINRRTVDNVYETGLKVIRIESYKANIVKLIIACP